MTTPASGRAGRLVFDRGLLFRQLASMLRSGLPLPQALAFLSEEFRRDARSGLQEVRRKVENGAPLSEALGALPPRWMSAELRSAVAAGETSGRLPEVLDALAAEAERQQGFDVRLRGILLYPISVLLLAALVLSIVVSRVFPVFTSLYASLQALNPTTEIRVPLGARILAGTWSVLGLPAIAVLLLCLVWLLHGLRDRNAPVVPAALWRPLARRLGPARAIRDALAELRFSRSLALLVGAGVPLPAALDLCARIVGDGDEGGRLAEASRRIQAGEAPSAVLSDLPFLSPAFLYFLSGTESRGDFLEVTQTMAEASEELLTQRVETALRVVEPASILALGALLGFIVVHVYWPMFQLSRFVGY